MVDDGGRTKVRAMETVVARIDSRNCFIDDIPLPA